LLHWRENDKVDLLPALQTEGDLDGNRLNATIKGMHDTRELDQFWDDNVGICTEIRVDTNNFPKGSWYVWIEVLLRASVSLQALSRVRACGNE